MRLCFTTYADNLVCQGFPGTYIHTKTDEFSEKFQGGGSIQKFMLQIFVIIKQNPQHDFPKMRGGVQHKR